MLNFGGVSFPLEFVNAPLKQQLSSELCAGSPGVQVVMKDPGDFLTNAVYNR